MTTFQEYLNQKYPTQAEKAEIKIIVTERKKHKDLDGGELDLQEFINLEEITIDGGSLKTPLKKINLTGLSHLKQLNLGYNELTSVDFLSQLPSPEKLTILGLERNNFAPTTLDFAALFINLKVLTLGTIKDKVQAGIFNRFYGSLEPLKNFTQLGLLCIANTDVDNGLEYLFLRDSKDKSRKMSPGIDCHFQFPNFKVRTLKNQLKTFDYEVWAWQLAHPEKMRPIRPEYFAEKGQWKKWLSSAVTDAEKNLLNQHLTPRQVERLKSKLNLLQAARTNYLKNPFSPLPNDKSLLSVISEAKSQIRTKLSEYNLKSSDLPSQFQNWETDLEKLDSKEKIRDFQQKLEQAVKDSKDKQQKSENNQDKSLSLPVKVAIGVGVVGILVFLVIVILRLAKKKKKVVIITKKQEGIIVFFGKERNKEF